jgi:hypothetical protein
MPASANNVMKLSPDWTTRIERKCNRSCRFGFRPANVGSDKQVQNPAPNLARNTPRTKPASRLKAAVQGRDGNALERALARALAHLAPGGRLHMVDFGQLERLPSPFRTLLFAWLRRFHVSPRADLPGRLHELS